MGPQYYKAEFDCNMTIIKANNIDDARKFANDYIGRMHAPRVSKADSDDVDWYTSMGGAIHDLTV